MWTPHSDPPLRLPILMEATRDLFRQNYKPRMLEGYRLSLYWEKLLWLLFFYGCRDEANWMKK